MPNGSGGWTYEYVIKDHLGNGRVWFAPNAAGTATVTRQEVHYDPFGFELEGINGAAAPTSPANACHYNGKELNPEFGIGWLDYGARWFEAALGRWWSVDPMAEKSYSLSVFNYTSNNPLRFVDPDGMYGREFSLVDEVRKRVRGGYLDESEEFKNEGDKKAEDKIASKAKQAEQGGPDDPPLKKGDVIPDIDEFLVASTDEIVITANKKDDSGVGLATIGDGIEFGEQKMYNRLVATAVFGGKKTDFRLASLNFSQKMPHFNCKICLASQKSAIFSCSKTAVATSLISQLGLI